MLKKITFFILTMSLVFTCGENKPQKTNLNQLAGKINFIPLTKDAPVPIIITRGNNIPFINKKNEFVFSLPKKHSPVVNVCALGSFRKADMKAHYDFNLFYDSLALIKASSGNYYLIDINGKIRKQTDKYRKIGKFQEGAYLGVLNGLNLMEEKAYVFLNQDFDNAFGNIKFWNAREFSNGMAAIELENKSDKAYLSVEGEIIRIKGIEKEKIKSLGDFSEGLANIEVEGKGDLFVNKKGEVVFDLRELFPNNNITCFRGYKQGIALLFLKTQNKYKDLILFNKKGATIAQISEVRHSGHFKNGYCILEQIVTKEDGEYLTFWLINKEGEFLHKMWDFDTAFQNDIGSSQLDEFKYTIGGAGISGSCLVSSKSLEKLAYGEGQIIAYDEKRILYSSLEKNTYWLRDYKGNLLMEIEDILL